VSSEKHHFEILKAVPQDAAVLTKISFAAKCHWRYPREYMDIWKDELTITSGYITENQVFIAVWDHKPAGFYSITENRTDRYSGEIFVEKGHWLEHIFILPEFHKIGIGSSLISHAVSHCRAAGIGSLKIFSDPYAAGFYEKLGARFLYDSKSSIPGREIPVYELKFG